MKLERWNLSFLKLATLSMHRPTVAGLREAGAKNVKRVPSRQIIEAKWREDRLLSFLRSHRPPCLSAFPFSFRALPWAEECDPFRVVHFIPPRGRGHEKRQARHSYSFCLLSSDHNRLVASTSTAQVTSLGNLRARRILRSWSASERMEALLTMIWYL